MCRCGVRYGVRGMGVVHCGVGGSLEEAREVGVSSCVCRTVFRRGPGFGILCRLF